MPLKEECGIVAFYSKNEHPLGKEGYVSLMALQHRGQESAGICFPDGNKLRVKKGLGLVQEVFQDPKLFTVQAKRGIAHVRYSTTGDNTIENAQPISTTSIQGPVAIAHNGNLINTDSIKEELLEEHYSFTTTIDSEIILHLLAKYHNGSLLSSLKKTLQRIRGAYSLVIMDSEKIYAARDPFGLRPLILGKRDDQYIIASESCALDVLGAEIIRDIERGEIIVIDDQGVYSHRYDDTKFDHICSFEYVYFSRPDSVLEGISVYETRLRAGEILAKKDEGEEFDLVAPVPDSGIAAATGYARAMKIPYASVLIKNKYVGRTFISPTQEEREMMLRLKLNVSKEQVKDKKIVLVDDSIVRGTTMKAIVRHLKKAGAKEVHVRISSPPVKHSCYFGIDTPERKSLISSHMDVDQVAEFIEADSLRFITPQELSESITRESHSLCQACFTGKYPMDIEDKRMCYEL